jgi:hypothetical protein
MSAARDEPSTIASRTEDHADPSDTRRPPYFGEREPVAYVTAEGILFSGKGAEQVTVWRNPRLVEDTSDIDVGQGNQARWVQKALSGLRGGGLVLDELSRPDLRRKIEGWIDAEIKRTGSKDLVPSRQVQDRVCDDWGLPPRGRLLD